MVRIIKNSRRDYGSNYIKCLDAAGKEIYCTATAFSTFTVSVESPLTILCVFSATSTQQGNTVGFNYLTVTEPESLALREWLEEHVHFEIQVDDTITPPT